MLQIGHHCGVDVFRACQGIKGDVAFDERVVAVYPCPGASILHMGIGCHVVEIVISVAELGDSGLDRERGAGERTFVPCPLTSATPLKGCNP